MDTPTLGRRQTTAPQALGVLRLPASVSPYFPTVASTRKEAYAGRVKIPNLILTMKAFIGEVSDLGNSDCRQSYNAIYHDGGGFVEKYNFDITFDDTITALDLRALIASQVLGHATSMTYSMTADDIVYALPSSLGKLPIAAIANCPADAVTNYNIVTTLLGTLTSAVNAANTKQNDIATKVNLIMAGLRTAGILAA